MLTAQSVAAHCGDSAATRVPRAPAFERGFAGESRDELAEKGTSRRLGRVASARGRQLASRVSVEPLR